MATQLLYGNQHLETGGAGTVYGSIENSDWPGRRVRDVSNRISLLDTDQTQLVTLLMKLRKAEKKGTDPKFEWQEDVFPELVITAAEANSSSEQVFTTADVGRVRVGDVLYHAETDEIMYVIAVTYSTTDTVACIRGVGNTNTSWISSGDTFFIIGNGKEMGSRSKEAITTQVAMEYNYHQNFSEPIGIDRHVDMTKLFGGPQMQYLLDKHGQVIKRLIERTFWFGERDLISATDSSSTYPATSATHLTRGVFHWLNSVNTNYDSAHIMTSSAGASLEEDDFNTFLETAGRYSSGYNFMFCSPRAMTVISSWGRDQLQAVPRDDTWGIYITRYRSPHQELNLINNKLFGDMTDAQTTLSTGMISTCSVILDLEQLRYHWMRDVTLEMNIQENDRDAIKHQYICDVGLELRLPKHHGLIWGWDL